MIRDLSSSDRTFLSASNDHQVRIWDATSGSLLRSVEHESKVLAAAFSRDGRYVASGTKEGYIRIWNASSRRLILGQPVKGNRDRDQDDVNARALTREESFLDRPALPRARRHTRPATARRNVPPGESNPHRSTSERTGHVQGSTNRRSLMSKIKRIFARTKKSEGNRRGESIPMRIVPAKMKQLLVGVPEPSRQNESEEESENEEDRDEQAHPLPDSVNANEESSNADRVASVHTAAPASDICSCCGLTLIFRRRERSAARIQTEPSSL